MREQEHHTMILETTHPSGAEEWYCQQCGRRILMTWPPDYKKIVLEAGDEYAIHSGGKGGLTWGGDNATPGDPGGEDILPDDTSLEPFDKWFEDRFGGKADG